MTFVVRVWTNDSFQGFETTHVQTGEVRYFQTIQSAAEHIERFAQSSVTLPIDIGDFQPRSDHA